MCPGGIGRAKMEGETSLFFLKKKANEPKLRAFKQKNMSRDPM
jgi:hypothetical protein